MILIKGVFLASGLKLYLWEKDDSEEGLILQFDRLPYLTFGKPPDYTIKSNFLDRLAELLYRSGNPWLLPTLSVTGKWVLDLDQAKETHSVLQKLDWATGKVKIDPIFEVEQKTLFKEVRKEPQVRFIVTPQMAVAPLDLKHVWEALWVLECEESVKQGTAFALAGVGVITCDHVLGPATRAFQITDPSRTYGVEVLAKNPDLDLAIIRIIDAKIGAELPLGSAESLKVGDPLSIAGFPNYRKWKDTGLLVPGVVAGFRKVASIRRILTNAPIVEGNSGGPGLNPRGQVIGVAVTGADYIEHADKTEKHGLVPVDALKYLTEQ